MNVAECNKNHSNVIKMPEKKYNIPYEYFDAVARIRIPGEQMQILSFIVRKTWCWGKDEDMLSVSQFVEATGLSRQHVYRAIKALIGKKIIIGTKDGSKSMQIFEINKDFSSWAVEPKKVHEPKLVLCGTKNGYKQEPKMEHTKEYNKAFKENTPLPPKGEGEGSFQEIIQNILPEQPETRKQAEVPVSEIAQIYNRILPDHAKVELDGSGKPKSAGIEKAIRSFYGRRAEFRKLDFYKEYFESIKSYPALNGDTASGWMPNLLWLLGPKNYEKVTTGFYRTTSAKRQGGYSRPPVNEPSGRLPEWKGYDD